MLSRQSQVKYIPTFSFDFQKMLLDISKISKQEQIDCCTRGRKSYILKDLCTETSKKLSKNMSNAKRAEAAHHRVGMSQNKTMNGPWRNNIEQRHVPTELASILLRKFTPAELEIA